MAEKHKSKYKKPENTKPKYRKDIKDYTYEDKDGKLNPYTTGEKQKNVLRKTDKEFVDTGDLYVKYKADDRLYKDVEDGEYDPKHAAKVLKKRQDDDEKLSKDQIKDKIENLTREGKERFIREYISRKIKRALSEQSTPDETAPAPDETAPAPDETAPAPDALDAISAATPTSDATATPAPDATATPPADATATPAPDATTPAPAEQKTPEDSLGISLQDKNVFDKVGSIISVIEKSFETVKDDPKHTKEIGEFYKFLLNDLVDQRNAYMRSQKTKK
jgi:hypothetical protein